jgi:hypothetical protein
MKICTKNIICPIAVAAFILTLLICCSAQTKKKKRPRWNWEKHQVEVIDYAKKYLVSDIEPNVPKMSFADWFQQIAGKEAKIVWDINDCGEQTGTSADRGRDFPMCLGAEAEKADVFQISVNIQFGTFGRGIMTDKPTVRFIFISREDDFGRQPENLSDLAKSLAELMSK